MINTEQNEIMLEMCVHKNHFHLRKLRVLKFIIFNKEMKNLHSMQAKKEKEKTKLFAIHRFLSFTGSESGSSSYQPYFIIVDEFNV